ncbi:hypothetical protein [Bradyrhizobium lupini]|uniref:hypothetical protein n=1 Tax=Rhizobium lupini TaxID=136996 RepID=UPI0034C6C682
MSNAIAQRAKIVKLLGDPVALNAARLKDGPQVLPQVVTAAAEEGSPKAEIQPG